MLGLDASMLPHKAYNKDNYDQHMENLHTKLGKLWEEHVFAQTSTIEPSEVDCLIDSVIEEEGHAYWHQKGDSFRGLKRTFDKIALHLDASREVVLPPSKESQKQAMSALIQACGHSKDGIHQVLDQVDRRRTTEAYASQVMLKLSEDVGVKLHPDLALKALVMPEGVAFKGMSTLNVDRMLPQKLVSAAEVAGYNVRAMPFAELLPKTKDGRGPTHCSPLMLHHAMEEAYLFFRFEMDFGSEEAKHFQEVIVEEITRMVLRNLCNMHPKYRAMSEEDVADHVKITFSAGSMWAAVTIVGVAFAAAVGYGIGCWRPTTVVGCNIQ